MKAAGDGWTIAYGELYFVFVYMYIVVCISLASVWWEPSGRLSAIEIARLVICTMVYRIFIGLSRVLSCRMGRLVVLSIV